ncbi:MAG: glycosyltransferase family 4 protein [Bacteroidia bacterium]|nr:glycosyltransferase family 4 protein [Bacteroidia bacterium]
MRIAVDSRFLLPHLEGFGRFTKEVASRLVREHPEVEWDLLFDRKPLPRYHFGPAQHTVILPPPTRHWTLYEVWWRLSVPIYLRWRKPDILFSTYGLLTREVGRKIPVVAFIHDVAFARHPEFLPKGWQAYYMRAMKSTIRYSKILIVNSHSVRQDILELFGAEEARIRIAYQGCDMSFFRPLPELNKSEVLNQYSEGCPYLFYIGSIHPRKNPKRLLQAYDRLRERYKEPLRLLLVGRFMFDKGQLSDSLREMRYASEVIFHPPVSDWELLKLYNAAAVVVYPSLYEGFGIPVAEALGCGVPVVTSRISSLPEVGGEAAFYANPYDPESIAEAIYQALTQSPEERALRAQIGRMHVERFSWQETLRVVWNSLIEVAS